MRFWFAVLVVASAVSFLMLYSSFQVEMEALSHPLPRSFKSINASEMNQTKPPLILFYTTWFGQSQWPWDMRQNDGQPFCHDCLLSYNKHDLNHSDAIVFHSRDIPSADTMRSLARNDRQRWVYLSHENPYNSWHSITPYNGIFNCTVTYRRDSDVFYPNGYFRKLQYPEEIPKDHFSTNYAKEKDKLIAWAVSHCGRLRDKIVHKLLKFVNVTVYGDCSTYFNQSKNRNNCKKDSKECSALLKSFKFYLSFENELCVDYITEKYWNTPFDHNMVPIVLGSNYDPAVAIPGSFINVLDFPSIEALANYIKYLDKNDTAYNEYFQWKTKYQRWIGDSWTCLLCANLHNTSLPKKVYRNFEAFWGIKSTCDRHNSKINKLLR